VVHATLPAADPPGRSKSPKLTETDRTWRTFADCAKVSFPVPFPSCRSSQDQKKAGDVNLGEMLKISGLMIIAESKPFFDGSRN
jgi:hypothetical protein